MTLLIHFRKTLDSARTHASSGTFRSRGQSVDVTVSHSVVGFYSVSGSDRALSSAFGRFFKMVDLKSELFMEQLVQKRYSSILHPPLPFPSRRWLPEALRYLEWRGYECLRNAKYFAPPYIQITKVPSL